MNALKCSKQRGTGVVKAVFKAQKSLSYHPTRAPGFPCGKRLYGLGSVSKGILEQISHETGLHDRAVFLRGQRPVLRGVLGSGPGNGRENTRAYALA